ncbi:four-helix bundle copper-binding protein, partial [Klebsiella pneumoniae]|nr:four-helix bundle copper-binding protein [Klebsiella pneumoniae]
GNECKKHEHQHCKECADACFRCAEACKLMAS